MRQHALGLFTLAGFMAFGTATTQAALISRYTFDNASKSGTGIGATYANSVSGAPVATVAEDTGGLTSGPTSVAGKVGQAVRFDGLQNYLNVAAAEGLPATSSLSQGTIAFWLRSTTTRTNRMGVMGVLNGDPNSPPVDINNDRYKTAFDVDVVGNRFRAFTRGNTPSDNRSTATYTNGNATASSSWANGEWHHLAISWDISNILNDKIYFDGIDITQPVGSNLFVDTVHNHLAAIRTYDSSWEYDMTLGAVNVRGDITWHLEGDLDELHVYDHLLSESEVIALATVPEASSMALFLLASVVLPCVKPRRVARPPVRI